MSALALASLLLLAQAPPEGGAPQASPKQEPPKPPAADPKAQAPPKPAWQDF